MAETDRSAHLPGDPDHDVDTRMIWRIAVGLTIGCLVAGALMLGVFFAERRHLDRSDPTPSPLSEARLPEAPPGPVLQRNPAADMKALRAAEDRLLTTYGWTDSSAGLARIPVERAMEIVVRTGLAPLPPAPSQEPAPPPVPESAPQQPAAQPQEGPR